MRASLLDILNPDVLPESYTDLAKRPNFSEAQFSYQQS